MLHLNKSFWLCAVILGASLISACSNIQKHDATTSNIINSAHQRGENQDWPSFGRDYANKRFSENAHSLLYFAQAVCLRFNPGLYKGIEK